MSKRIVIKSQSDINIHLDKIMKSAEMVQAEIRQLVSNERPYKFLSKLKFMEIGYDPIDFNRRLNFIEQLNQSVTYIASFKAANYLLQQKPLFRCLKLNLGTASGWDIESEENGKLVAEVFAAVNPANNRKLKKDIIKVTNANAKHRYVFFMSPGFEVGPYRGIALPQGVNVVSFGLD